MIPAKTILNSRYRIIQQLGAGGMGTIYQAVDENLNCIVAVKEAFAGKDEHRRAFRREAQLLANLEHPALPRVMDHFTHDNGQFLVMQFIPGNDLAELLSMSEGPFAIDKILEWADYLLDALEELHSYSPPIVHRDIKPSNLKLTPKGKIILLDFGLAKGTIGQMSTADADNSAKSIYGYTRHYAPFEQITGAGTDPRSDLYSLAATLWSLLTAELPPDALARAGAREEGEPDPLRPAHEKNTDVPPGIAAVLHQAMSLNRSQRPASAVEMRRMLREAAQANSVAHQRAAEESARRAEEKRQRQEAKERQRAEKERLAAEAQRKAEEERQRREEDEERRAEEEEEERKRQLAAIIAARRAAREQQREKEEKERREAQEHQRLEAKEAARQRAVEEEERARAEAESRKRADQEAERRRVEAEQEASRRRLEEKKQARAEEERLRREAEGTERQRASEQAVQASREEKQTEPPNLFAAATNTIPASGPITQHNYSQAHADITGATTPRAGKNRRAMLLAIIACFLILSAATLIWMRQAPEGEQQSARPNVIPTSTNQSEATTNTQQADQAIAENPNQTTSMPSPTATPKPTPLKEEDKQKEETVVPRPAPAAPELQKKNISSVTASETAGGSRITITSDGPLNDYSAYRSGDRYYVVIPEANASRAQGGLRGRGFEDVQVQKRGNDAILSFKLQPGTNARASQRFNQLDVEITPPKN